MAIITPSNDPISQETPSEEAAATHVPPVTVNLLAERTFTDTDVEHIKLDQTGQTCLDIRKVRVLEGRGRKQFTDIIGMKESLERFGFFSPVVLAPAEDGMYDLIAGERRTRAFLLTGQRYIPFTLKVDYTDLLKKEAELEENLRRKDLDWPEQVELMAQIDEIKRKHYGDQGIKNPTGWSIEKTAEVAGTSKSTAQRHLAVAKLLRERPELKAQVAHLPLAAAVRQLDRIQETEQVQDKISRNEVQIASEVRLGDSRVLIKEYEGGFFDAIITDPPFGNSEIEEQRTGSRGVQVYTGTMKGTDNLTAGEVRVLMTELIPELYRVLRDDGYLFMFFAFEHYDFLQTRLRNAGFTVEWAPIIWNKDRSTGAFTGYTFPASYEPIILAKKENPRRLKGIGKNILNVDPIHSTKKKHPFQKPPKLLAQLLDQCTIPGNKVLDPFGGSGELVRVAKAMNRNAVAFEIDNDNWARAQLNLAEPLPDGSIVGLSEGVAAPAKAAEEDIMAKLIAASKGAKT